MTAFARIGLVASRELSAERRQPDGVVAAVTFIAVLVLLESLVVGPANAREATVAAALTGDATAALAWAGLLASFAVVYTVIGLTIVPAAIE